MTHVPQAPPSIIELYALCWNDAPMLPYFFRHYDRFVARYVIFDDDSDETTLRILRSHPKVEIRRFHRTEPASFVLSEQQLGNECWKESRGRAQWVIVTDIDEHLCHPNMPAYLTSCAAQGVTIIPALGFQMISDAPPPLDAVLAETLTFGVPWEAMMKLSIFDPNSIDEIQFDPGRHRADPTGIVQAPVHDEVHLLHYKYLGIEATHRRHMELGTGLGEVDHQRGWGHKYHWSWDELSADWEQVKKKAIDVRRVHGCGMSYPRATWWDAYRIAKELPHDDEDALPMVYAAQGRSGSSTSVGSVNSQKRTCILVLGMHRSGTSAITRILNIAGARLPERIMPPGIYNRMGHWEPAALVEFHDRVLLELSSRWDDWRSLRTEALGGSGRAAFKARIREILTAAYGNAPLFVVKDPRICRFASLFLEALDEAGFDVKVLLVIRNPLEVAESLKRRKTEWSDNRSIGYAGLLWLRHLLDSEVATRTRCRTLVSFNNIFVDWKAELGRITRSLSILQPFDLDEIGVEVNAFLKPDERHCKRSYEAVRRFPGFGGWIADAFEALLELERSPGNDTAIAILGRIGSEFDECARMMASRPLEDLEAFVKSEGTGLHLQVDSRRLDPVYTDEDEWAFILPRSFCSLRLCFEAVNRTNTVPNHLRRGLCLWSIEVSVNDHMVSIPLDHPALGYNTGKLRCNVRGICHITDGDISIPRSLIGDLDRPVVRIRGVPQLGPMRASLFDEE
jgi:hypothetical protein